MKAKPRVSALRGRASRHSRCQRVGRDRIFLCRRLGQTEDRAQQPGYPGDVGSSMRTAFDGTVAMVGGILTTDGAALAETGWAVIAGAAGLSA
jgi:hypothetical protein